MDFMNRGMRPQTTEQPAGTSMHSARHTKDMAKPMKIASVSLLFSIAVLVLAVALSLFFGGTKTEAKFVNKKQLQAVFLNGGQVYFGHIGSLNEKYMSVTDIYYLRVNQQVQPNQTSNASNDISLVKLGCELHGPQDSMVINREQVVFWENLKDDGQVAKAVVEYKKANPNGQSCTATNTTAPASTNTTAPATTTPTTKKQ